MEKEMYNTLLESFKSSLDYEMRKTKLSESLTGISKFTDSFLAENILLKETFSNIDDVKSEWKIFTASLDKAKEAINKDNPDDYYSIVLDKSFEQCIMDCIILNLFCLNDNSKKDFSFKEVCSGNTPDRSFRYIYNRLSPSKTLKNVSEIPYLSLPNFYYQCGDDIVNFIKTPFDNKDKRELEKINFYLLRVANGELRVSFEPFDYDSEAEKFNKISLTIVNTSSYDFEGTNNFSDLYSGKTIDLVSNLYRFNPSLKNRVHNYLVSLGFPGLILSEKSQELSQQTL